MKIEITEHQKWLLGAAIFVLTTPFGEEMLEKLAKAKGREVPWDAVETDLNDLIEIIDKAGRLTAVEEGSR